MFSSATLPIVYTLPLNPHIPFFKNLSRTIFIFLDCFKNKTMDFTVLFTGLCSNGFSPLPEKEGRLQPTIETTQAEKGGCPLDSLFKSPQGMCNCLLL